MMSERIKQLQEDYQNSLSKFNEALDLPLKTNDPRFLLLPLTDKKHENYETHGLGNLPRGVHLPGVGYVRTFPRHFGPHPNLGYDPGEFTPLGYVRSHMNNLYGRLIKNTRSILKFERKSFPSLPYSREELVATKDQRTITTIHHTFGPRSATLGAAFTTVYPALKKIADTLTTTDINGNVNCLGISSGIDRLGETDSAAELNPIYTNSEVLKPGDNIVTIKELCNSNSITLKHLPDLIKQCHTDNCTPDKDKPCTNPEHNTNDELCTDCPDKDKRCTDPEHTNELCTECKVCLEHGKILAASLEGITKKSAVFDPKSIGADNDSIGADNERVLHFKNLISTCNNLANHLSDHGGNADTYTSYDWMDGMDHIRATDFLRQVSQVLTSSASKDNRDSIAEGLPPGGFQHRDNIPEVSSIFPSFFGLSHNQQNNGDNGDEY